MAVKGSEPSEGVIVPHLVVNDADQAVSFYQRAFGADELYRSPSPSGAGVHVHLRIWNSLIWLSTEEPEQASHKMELAALASPETLGGSTCVFQIYVEDADAVYSRAVDAGASPIMPLMDMFWGDRYGWVRDPFGHHWAITTIKEVLTPDEIRTRMLSFTGAKSQ
jgi:PhnB protein